MRAPPEPRPARPPSTVVAEDDPAVPSHLFGSSEPIAPAATLRTVERAKHAAPGWATFYLTDSYGVMRLKVDVMLRDLNEEFEQALWARLDVLDPPAKSAPARPPIQLLA